MAIEEVRPELLSEFKTAFEAIAQALATAAEQCSFAPAESAAELLGLKEQGNGKPSQTHVWERTEGGLSLWLQWHWYDQSHPFSIQPDMNKLKLEMRRGPAVLRRAEASYED
jgi:hypothetical protein